MGDKQMQTRQFTLARREAEGAEPGGSMSVCEQHGGAGGLAEETRSNSAKSVLWLEGKTGPCCDCLSVFRRLRCYNLKLSKQSQSEEGKGHQT